MDKPEVSIIIPAYNAGRWLTDAVNSVLAQTFTDWELIVVNDGSTDGTRKVLTTFHDPRIQVLDQANAGVSAARNAGIAAARGNYIGFLDADDAMSQENLRQKVALLRKTGVDWVFGDMALCSERLEPTGEVLIGTDGDVLRTLLLNNRTAVPIACSNVLASRHCFERGVAFDLELSNAADQDFTLQLATRFPYRHLPGVSNRYRVLPGSMSKNVARYQDDHLRFFRKIKAQGFLDDRRFRRECMGNVYWAIGGSWWLMANKPFKAIPFFVRAAWLHPKVIIRPVRNRVLALMGRARRPSGHSSHLA